MGYNHYAGQKNKIAILVKKMLYINTQTHTHNFSIQFSEDVFGIAIYNCRAQFPSVLPYFCSLKRSSGGRFDDLSALLKRFVSLIILKNAVCTTLFKLNSSIFCFIETIVLCTYYWGVPIQLVALNKMVKDRPHFRIVIRIMVST